MNNLPFSCSHCSQINDLRTMSKRQIQEGKQGGEEERVVANSRPARRKSLYDFQSGSNGAEFEPNSQLREHLAMDKKQFFNFGFIKYGETHRFSPEFMHWRKQLRDRQRALLVKKSLLEISLHRRTVSSVWRRSP